MTAKKKKPSATVNLSGLTDDDLRTVLPVAVFAEPPMPELAVNAAMRLQSARLEGRSTISKVDRASLTALVEFLRPHRDKHSPAFRAGFDKLDQRLRARMGRRVNAAEWKDRAAFVAATVAAFERTNGYTPTDAQVDAAIGKPRGTFALWRSRYPDLFAPPARD